MDKGDRGFGESNGSIGSRARTRPLCMACRQMARITRFWDNNGAVIGILRKFIRPALLGASLLVAGCLDEKDTITVYPDGSGVLHLHKRLGEMISGFVTGFADKKNPQAALDSTLYKDLSEWEGVTAWTGCKAAMDGKCVVTDATAYFDDVSKLRQTEGKQSFTWASNDDGGFTFAWNNSNGSDKDPLDQTSSPEQIAQMVQMMKDLKVVHEVFMPGTVTSAAGAQDHEGRSASSVVTGDDVIRFFGVLDDYRARVAKGDIPKAQASAEVKEKGKVLSMNMQVTCGPANVDDEFAQFQKDFASARDEFASADTASRIEEERKHRSATK